MARIKQITYEMGGSYDTAKDFSLGMRITYHNDGTGFLKLRWRAFGDSDKTIKFPRMDVTEKVFVMDVPKDYIGSLFKKLEEADFGSLKSKSIRDDNGRFQRLKTYYRPTHNVSLENVAFPDRILPIIEDIRRPFIMNDLLGGYADPNGKLKAKGFTMEYHEAPLTKEIRLNIRKRIKYELWSTQSPAIDFKTDGFSMTYFCDGTGKLCVREFDGVPGPDEISINERNYFVHLTREKTKNLVHKLMEAEFFTYRSRARHADNGVYQKLKTYRPLDHEIISQNYGFPRELREAIEELRLPFKDKLLKYKDPNRNFAREKMILPKYVIESSESIGAESAASADNT